MSADFVYFIRNPQTGLIKVGHSGDVATRLRQLERDEGCRLVVLGMTTGGSRAERKLHKAMDAFRVRGEWFTPNSFIADYLEFELAFSQQDVSRQDVPRLIAASERLNDQVHGRVAIVPVADVRPRMTVVAVTESLIPSDSVAYWDEWAGLL